MNAKIKKAWNELWVHPTRTFTVVGALALGIFGAGMVLVSYVILTNDLQENFLRTVPSHAILTMKDSLTLAQLEDIRQIPYVESVERREFSLQRIEVKKDKWIPLWLCGVEDFKNQQIAKITSEEGLAVPDPGTILIERDGRLVSDIKTGSRPMVRIIDSIFPLTVSGICFDPGQAPATQDAFIYAYTDCRSFQSMTGLATGKRLLIRFKEVNSAEQVKNKITTLSNELGEKKLQVISSEVPAFNQHPHQWQLDTLLLLIGSIGMLAFLMGVVLVSQLMNAMLAGQVRQIGIMKSIGATRWQIMQIYLFMLVIIGLMASVIAVPASVWAGNSFSAFVASKLNFNILTTQIPFFVLSTLIVTCITLPILLSLPTILKAVGVSVREALVDYGIVMIKSPEIPMPSWIPTVYRLALRNSFRNGKRLLVTVFAMSLAVAIFSTGFNVRQSLWDLLQGVKEELRYDVQIVLNQPVSRQNAHALIQPLPNVKSVEYWSGGRGKIQSKVMSTNLGVGLVALPIKTELLKLEITQGRWIRKSSVPEVVMNQQALSKYHFPTIGSDIEMNIAGGSFTARLVGITEQFDEAKIYMDIEVYDALFNPEHLINTISLVAKDNQYDQVMLLKENIEKQIKPSSLNVLYVMSQAERVKIVYDHLNIILTTIVLLSFLVLVVSIIGMASAMGINIRERTREIGVMRAIGAEAVQINRLLVAEGMLLVASSMFLGMIISFPLSKTAAVFFGHLMLGETTTMQLSVNGLGIFITLSVTALAGWLASRLPARIALKQSTLSALSYA